MERKPDIIRAVVLIFAAGLVITGFTSLQASEDGRHISPPQYSAGGSDTATSARD